MTPLSTSDTGKCNIPLEQSLSPCDHSLDLTVPGGKKGTGAALELVGENLTEGSFCWSRRVCL